MTKRYCTLFIIILISYSAIYAEVQAEEYDAVLMDEDTLDSRPLFESQDVPEVLTATRLRQPRVEVPGSMTIITAEQIAAWGVRTIPELMRFVPGMFVKHGANDTVAYHASSPNFMRRFQVLVDGRSVYRVILSSITWEEIPVAVEDIQRIEVFRGPNSATYGANAFMAVVNIITFNPSDTLGTQASVRTGSQMTRDYRVSHSAMSGTASYRISLNQQGDDGFDGVDAEHDELSDSKKTRFVNGSYADVIFNDVQLSVDASYLTSSGELPIDDTQIDPTIEHVNAYSLMTQINADLSKQHKLEAQAYVQTHERLADGYGCLPTASIDPTLYALYERNPLWASVIGEGITGVYANEAVDSPTYQQADALVRGISAGVVTPELVEAQLESAYDYDFVIEQQDLADAAQVFSRAFNGSDFNNLGQVLCGTGDYDFSEQRVDVEMEFTSQWLDNLRTAAGLGYRRDTVKSDVYFGGTRINNNYRVFGNAEWRIFSPLVMNLGGTYEREDINDDVFSPRVAFTYLLTQQQSLRLVYAEAIRSPDLLEQRPNYIGKATNIQTDNYLNLENGRYFAHQTERRHLDHERIQSWEIGYYGSYLQQRLMLDIKLYRDHLSQLIANATGIRDFNPSSDLEMNIDGVDAQVHWRPNVVHEFWWSGAYVNNRVNIGNVRNYSADQIDSLSQIETRLSAEYSNNVNWIMRHNDLSLSQSYFWHNAYNGNRGKGRAYRRYEMNINKNWPVSYGELSTGIFWHHIVNNEQFIYEDEQIASNDIVLFKLGMQF